MELIVLDLIIIRTAVRLAKWSLRRMTPAMRRAEKLQGLLEPLRTVHRKIREIFDKARELAAQPDTGPETVLSCRLILSSAEHNAVLAALYYLCESLEDSEQLEEYATAELRSRQRTTVVNLCDQLLQMTPPACDDAHHDTDSDTEPTDHSFRWN